MNQQDSDFQRATAKPPARRACRRGARVEPCPVPEDQQPDSDKWQAWEVCESFGGGLQVAGEGGRGHGRSWTICLKDGWEVAMILAVSKTIAHACDISPHDSKAVACDFPNMTLASRTNPLAAEGETIGRGLRFRAGRSDVIRRSRRRTGGLVCFKPSVTRPTSVEKFLGRQVARR